MAFTIVYDACILFPISLRDLFIRLGQTGLYSAKWTEQILDEWLRAVTRTYGYPAHFPSKDDLQRRHS